MKELNKNKEKWSLVVSFKTELLSEALTHKGYRESLPRLLPDVPEFRNRMIIDNDIYIDTKEASNIENYFENNTKDKANKVYKIIRKQSKNLIKKSDKLSKNVRELSNKELLKRLRIYFHEYQNTIGMVGIPTIIDFVVEKKVREILKRNSVENIDETLLKLAIPYKPIESFKERHDLIRIAFVVSNRKLELDSARVNSMLDNHYKKYGWLHSTLFLGDLYKKDEIKQNLKQILRSLNKSKNTSRKREDNQLLEAKNVLKRIDSSSDRKLVRFLQKSVYFRTARLEWLNKSCFLIRPLLEKAAEKLGIKFSDLIYLLPEEIMHFLENYETKKVDMGSVKERQKGYVYISDNNKEYFLVTGKNLEDWKHKFNKKYEKDSDTIKGVSVSKGGAKGKVVIVKDRSELYKVSNGDILVAKLTTPDFLMAMQKASAIVTDLGGVTSHAAIASRELEIPCVVGTKYATKVLQDGEKVEVDANDGTVKKIEKGD